MLIYIILKTLHWIVESCGLNQGNWLFSDQAPTWVCILSFQTSHGLNTVMLRHDKPPAESVPGPQARTVCWHFSPLLDTLYGSLAVFLKLCLITFHQKQFIIGLLAYSLKHTEILRFPSVHKDTDEYIDIDKYIFVRQKYDHTRKKQDTMLISLYNSPYYVRNWGLKAAFIVGLFNKIWHLLKVLFTCTGLDNAVDLFIQNVKRIIPKECKITE